MPITIAEQIESAQEAFEAGAAIAHVHVRRDDETPTSDPDPFALLAKGLRKHCPGLILQFSTGGRLGRGAERGGMLHFKPDMASLATGSCNFLTIIYENHPSLIRELAAKMMEHGIKPEIEVFDLSMLYQALQLADEGVFSKLLHVQFVFGIKNAMPAIRDVLEFEVKQLAKLMPEATWTAAGIGRHQLEVNRWSLELGGHCRTGLEDNIRIERDRLADSNAELVRRVASLCADCGRMPATATEARKILRLV